MMGRYALLEKLERTVAKGDLSLGLDLLTAFTGAQHYLLARYDVFAEDGFDYVVSSDWAFDLLRTFGAELVRSQSKRNELDRCLATMEPELRPIMSKVRLPSTISRTYGLVPFNAGAARLVFIVLYESGVTISADRLRDTGLIVAYYASRFREVTYVPESVLELTEREIECLNWIAEGKTSDEISMIIGISRNTVNNYITSIMRKTATKTRSEAIAYAVRNSLI